MNFFNNLINKKLTSKNENFKHLKIGLIGAGTQGTILSSLIEESGAKLVAVHDTNLVRARKLKLLHKADLATDKLEEFFNINMDGVLICTMPKVRIEPIKLACKNKIHLLIEKPAAYNLKEGQECYSLIKNSNIISSVGFQLRYEPRYERLKEIIKNQEIHLVRTVCTVDYFLNYKMPDWYLKNELSGGPVAEQAIHLLDIVRFILGNPKATNVSSFGVRNMEVDKQEYDSLNAVQLMYELDNKAIGVHTNHSGHENTYFDLELIGPHTRLYANASEKNIHGIINGKKINEITPEKTNLGLNKVTAWLKAIKTGDRKYIKSDFLEALNTQSLVDAAIKSNNTKNVVSII
jgi:predicted dehydrogenase